uniref:ATP-dependent DNA helicase n=1 Tax=Chromera velia CCMP2878 TaxID=1169474 RepID=A0A0G4F0L8_9ALVE|eukprot:Cvel_14454.t1-p1 / transcript=Cvel_14454.t1 / gene=Cvel_14454 / organism=Chromera_velia_CCMP2878 / gene_product=hypothetical protein / transcript_product=hypothetical protein / location=Cvel_scaffold1029:19082-20233(-) / protein_length=384 / sequence_SO=supercontig / SO=protein_coding / is_pseudo=false
MNPHVYDILRRVAPGSADFEGPVQECPTCRAQVWKGEEVSTSSHYGAAKFSICCSHGRVQLKRFSDPPASIKNRLQHGHPDHAHLIENVRAFNTSLSFASVGVEIDRLPSGQQGTPALAVASTGIAATLLPLASTAHAAFGVPLKIEKDSVCAPSKNSAAAQIVRQCRLIVWDEVTMSHKYIIAAVKRWLEDVCGGDEWGGKVIVFSGDWQQCLPVIPKAPRATIVASTMKKWEHWRPIQVRQLTQNMRVQRLIAQGRDPARQQAWADLLRRVGRGRDGDTVTLAPSTRSTASDTDGFIKEIFGDISSGNIPPETIASRAILAPRNEDVNEVNKTAIDMFPGQETEFLSVDMSTDPEMGHLLVPEFLNTLQPSNLLASPPISCV